MAQNNLPNPLDALNDLTRKAAGLGPNRPRLTPSADLPLTGVEPPVVPPTPEAPQTETGEVTPVPLGGFPEDDLTWLDRISEEGKE